MALTIIIFVRTVSAYLHLLLKNNKNNKRTFAGHDYNS